MAGSEPQQPEQQKAPDVDLEPTLVGANQISDYSANNQPNNSSNSAINNTDKQLGYYWREFRIHFRLSAYKTKLYFKQNFNLKTISRNANLAVANGLKFYYKHRLASRLAAGSMALLIVFSIGFEIYNWRFNDVKYQLSAQAEQLLGRTSPGYAQKLTLDVNGQQYVYNDGYTATMAADSAGQTSGPKFSGSFPLDPKKSIAIKDVVNSVDLKLTPKFGLDKPTKSENRLIYPVTGMDAAKVYTLRAGSVKEDFVIEKFQQKDLSFRYGLELSSGTEARLENDGSIGVYGVDQTLLGNVTASSEKDQQLLQKARETGKKTELLFTIPAPFIIDATKSLSKAKSWFSLENNIVTLHASGLDSAQYPITIDPSVYIETASKLMRGNNETNTDFDVENELIQKSQTTGARINSWSSTSNLTSAVWGQGTAVAGGYIYSAGGVGSSNTVTSSYTSAGSTSYSVPAGVTSVTVKVWGGGGGAGAGTNGTGVGGSGGGGGFAKAVINVTPGESLTVDVGAGGAKASANGRAGNGGTASTVKRSSTILLEAGAGGGGSGRRGNTGGTIGNGGAGGGLIGIAGTAGSTGGPGQGGTQAAGGARGTAGAGGAVGVAGVSQGGGNGSSIAACATAATGTGSNGSGGAGGTFVTTCAPGGGGGGGYYGGGGGGSTSTNARTGGGGGGGSSYINPTGLVSGTDQNTAGSGTAPGSSSDGDRANLADGGTSATTAAAATAGENGVVVISYTTPGTVTNAVSWAKFNTTTNAIESPNPGTGACTGWCTNSVYNLPTALSGLSLVAYNGFLYAMGGSNSSGSPQTSVYIAKIGANGEPQLWHPSGGTPTYWYTDTALISARSQFAAVAYNNRMYILGGLTTSNTVLNTNTVQYANINPMGTFSAWTSTGMSSLTTARYGLTAQVYNSVLYVLGGNATFTGTPVNTVEYARLNNDGTMNSWVATSSMLTSGRQSGGGSFSTIFGGYVYINGGCTAVNASGYCTSIATDVQLASINADGSLSEWNTILGLTNDRFAHTLIAWQGGLYRLGGCRAQDPTTGVCTDTVLDVDYGVINPDGEASTVATSVLSGSAPCSGGAPYSCDLPAASVGNMLNASVILNGYLYIMGGCTNNACTSYSSGVVYQAIGSDGTLQKPASCNGTYTDSYCVSSVSLPTAIGAPGVATFNGRIYIVGGFPTINNIYYVGINNDGSLGAWQNNNTVVGATTTADDVSYTFAYARANPSSASTNPGNLYIFGGCSGTISGIGCSGYSEAVYKCNIRGTDGAVVGCTTSGQLQIGVVPGSTNPGLGAHAGAVYANYIYLMGGLTPDAVDLQTVRYAKFDDNNNVVTAGTGWVESPSQILVGRRRGAGFGYNGYLYVTGGYDGTDALADIEYARIDVSNGSIGSWVASSVSINKRWGLTAPVSNSYAYVIGGCIAGAAPSSCSSRTNSIQTFQIYNNDSGALKSVSSMSDDTFATNTDRWGASSTIINGTIYVAGGCTSATDCTATTTDVQKATISSVDGSVGAWSSTTAALPAPRAWGKLLSAGGYLYYLGGQDNTSTNQQSTIYYAQPSAGNITSWASASGGIGDTASQAAVGRTKFGAAVWNDRIYIVGGIDDSDATTNTVYISPQLASGGNIAANSWVSDADVPDVARYGGAVVTYANNLYLFGGTTAVSSGSYLNDSQFTQINQDGTIDPWTFTTSLSGYVSEAEAFAANGYVYVVGGRSSATNCSPNTLVAPISANTTIATGNNPTGVGEWSETNVRYAGGRYGAAVAYDTGKMYITGGGCTAPQNGTYNTGTITQSTTTITGTGTNWTDNYIGGTITYQDASTATIVSVNDATHITVSTSKTIASAQTYSISVPRNSYAVVKSQPQVAIYSRMIDTDTDVFPTKWLMNGLDNSIGARWQVRYRSMHDISDGASQQNPTEDCGTSLTMPIMSTWGQETNFGNVTLGSPATYTPINESGGNINCARYYYFYVTIDASKTFGYPEDVNRGPTITDLSLFFTADPSKRLRHGKTFTGGEQQPLDTPF